MRVHCLRALEEEVDAFIFGVYETRRILENRRGMRDADESLEDEIFGRAWTL